MTGTVKTEKTKMRGNRYLVPGIQLLLAVFSFGYALFFIRYNYYTLMNSDTSGELILGRLLSREGGILSTAWDYSTELRVINTQLIYKLVFMVVGDNWMLVRFISNSIMLLMLAAGYLFMMHALGRDKEGRWTVWMLFLPFGANYGYIVVYGAFYIPHILFTFISVGLMALAIKGNDGKRYIAFGLLVLAAFLSGMGGARQALICYIPAVIVGGMDMLLRFLTDRGEVLKRFIVVTGAFAGNILGVAFNGKVLSGRFNYVNQPDKYLWEGISPGNFLDVFGDLISTFGMCFDETSFMGVYGAVNFLCLGFAALIIWGLYILISRRQKLDDTALFYLAFIMVSILFCGFVYSCCRKEYYMITYWAPFMPLLYPVPLMALEYFDGINLRKAMPLLVAYTFLAFLLGSHVTLKNPFDIRLDFMQEGKNLVQADEVIRDLPDQGVAPFWIANNFTEYTNGRKEMWAVEDSTFKTFGNGDRRKSSWLQNKIHEEKLPEGKFFVATFARVLDDPEYFAYTPLFLDESHMVYSDDHLTIYVFEDYNDFKNTLEAVGAYE